ncbi:MAG: hypothetical protein J1F03_01245 [Oscillospiraceae bacterium]|nr:hypothetical protein [Oscillospiraceae bacterium]
MEILQLCGVGLLSAVICLILRKFSSEAAFFVSAAAGVIIFAMVISMLASTVNAVKELSEQAGIDLELVGILLKALAVCYITALCSGIARDAGESSAAIKLELGGRAAIAAISLPVFVNLAKLVTGLIYS